MKIFATIALGALLPALAAGAFPDVEGWEPIDDARSYGPDNLWEEIDGAAESFLAYGFLGLDARELRQGDFAVSVGVYDMATPLNAFGIFRAEAATGTDTIPIGTATSILAPYQGVMFQGRFFVKVSAYDGPVGKRVFARALAAVAEVLPGEPGWPAAIDLLPAEYRRPRTEAYVRESYLGLKELGRCVEARYLDDRHRKYRAFAIVTSGDDDLRKTWAALAAKWIARDGNILVREIPYEGPVGVILAGDRILGLTGFDREEDLVERLREIAAGEGP